MSLKFGKHALLVLAVLLMLVLIPTSFAENVADGNVVGANGDSAIDSVQQVAVGNMGDDIQQVANDEIVFESAADDMVIVSDESDVLGYGEEYITSPSPTNITDYHIGDSKDIVVTPTIDEGCRSEIENYLDEVYVYIDDDFDGRIVIPDVGTTSAFNFNLNAFTADQLSVGTHTLRFGVDYKSLENRGYSTALNPLTVTVVSGEGDEPGGDINVIYVDAKNRNDSADGSKENPFATIARAIEENAARGGNWTIIVNVGDYCLSDVVISDDVIIKFEKDASIDANGTSVFIVKNGASLTLINADIFGAVNAIVTEANTTLTIVDSMFTVNDGVIVSNGSTTIYRTHFFLNDGTVIKADEGSLDVSYSIFDQNNGTLIDSGIQAIANDNFWGTNLPNDLENVTIDTWVVLIASFEEAPDIFTGVMYNITVEFISNDGSDLGDILPRCYPEAEATLGVVEGYIIIEQNYGVANYIATEVGSGVINIFSDSLLQSIPVNATEDPTGKIFVSTNGSDETGNGSKENPFATIVRAIEENAARGGNWTIIVNVGDYCLSDVVISDDVIIKFEKDASIDANGTSVFIVKNGASLTLINADIFGAVNAIVTEANTTLTIVDSMFTVNDGVIVSNGSTTIYRTHFFLNDGTVIKAVDGSLDVSYSIFDQNNGTLIDSGIQAIANDNFWGTNLPNDLENVTIDTWVVLIASFEEAPDIFTGVMYNITVEFISNDGSDLGDILPRCYPEAEATLGVVEGYIIIEQNYGVANYIATEVGSGVINIFSDSLLQSIPVNATAEDTNTTINATVNGFVVTIIVNVNATGIVNEGNVKLTFNNQTKTASVVNGVAKFTFDNVNAGTYNIAANYEGTTLFNPSNATSSVKVVKLQAYVKPIYKIFVFNYGHLYQFTLKDKAGNPIAGRTVLFSIHGKYYSAVTNSKGVGQIKITPKMLITAGKFFTRLTFKGDGQYKAHSYPIWITALKETTKLSVKSGSYKISANKVVTATLKDSKNKIIKNKVVYIKINGKTVSAKTDAKGVATFKLNNVPFNKVGKYAFTVTFKEDKAYKQSTAKGTLTIT